LVPGRFILDRFQVLSEYHLPIHIQQQVVLGHCYSINLKQSFSYIMRVSFIGRRNTIPGENHWPATSDWQTLIKWSYVTATLDFFNRNFANKGDNPLDNLNLYNVEGDYRCVENIFFPAWFCNCIFYTDNHFVVFYETKHSSFKHLWVVLV
jgi:hypothetical protein